MHLLVLLGILAVSTPGDTLRVGPEPQVITAAMIRESGLTRPSDLLMLIDGWQYVSLDGFHHLATAGWGTPASNTWALWIDGQPVPAGFAGTMDLNLLPVALQDIAYVEAYSGPVMEAGTFAGEGLIHIHTKRAAARLGARARYWQGNETGDPGPLRYVGESGNVDKLGPDLAASLFGGSGRVRALVSAVSRDHHPTDAAILSRFQPLTGLWPNIVTRGYSGRVSFEGRRSAYAVSGYHATAADYLWLKPYGTELPVENGFSWAGLDGSVGLGRSFRLHQAAGVSTSRLGGRENLAGFDPEWQRDQGYARVEVVRAGALGGALGVKVEGDRVRSYGSSINDPAAWGTVYGHITGERGNTRFHVGGSAAGGRRDAGSWGVLASASQVLNARQQVYAQIGYSRGSLRDEAPVWYWTRAGAGILDTLGVEYTGLDRLRQSRNLSAEAGWRYQDGDRLKAGAALSYGRRDGLNLERQLLSLATTGPVYFGPVDLMVGVSGYTIGGRVYAQSRIGPHFRQRSTASARFKTDGAGVFGDAWRVWPAVTAQTSVTYAPAPSFSLNTRLAYASRAFWTDVPDEALSGDNGLDSRWVLDVTAQKGLWANRIRGSIIVRNALDRRYRNHPRGETTDLSLIMHLSVYLNDR